MTASELKRLAEASNMNPYYLAYAWSTGVANPAAAYKRDGTAAPFVEWNNDRWAETRERIGVSREFQGSYVGDHLDTLAEHLNAKSRQGGSRYTLEGAYPGIEVVVGWDPPLETFYAQVKRPAPPGTDDDPEMLVWGGTSPHEISEPESLRRWTNGHAEVDKALIEMLRNDKALGPQPTPLQRQVRGMMRS